MRRLRRMTRERATT
ncbi:hypothetical protein [Caulobacter sp. UC70_42]